MDTSKKALQDGQAVHPSEDNTSDTQSETTGTTEAVDHLARKLSSRQVQMMTIGGSIGTALFVSIGTGLLQAGPGSLLIAFLIYGTVFAAVINCMAEMSIYMPVSGGWIRLGTHWVDDALGFMMGWNFFLYQGLIIPFEITALNLVITFWSDNVPPVAICLACIFLYGLINIFAVGKYGESEFWLAIGKVILILIVFGFTFVTMVGGNPQRDAYGFRYWNDPGAFAEFVTTGSLGRFEGFLAGLWRAALIMCGPEYISILAGEVSNPRKILKTAYRTLYWRFGVFFVGSAIAVGIVIPYNDKTLVAILSGEASGSGTGAASPYVIAMQNMGISILPHITNALLITSIFSAGNSYVYCASRALYSLSLDGHAPKFLQKCTKAGVPIYCFGISMLFTLISLLSLGNSASVVISWLVNLVTASQLIDFLGMCLVYLGFYRAMKAQGMKRDTLPYKGWWQPFCAWYGLCGTTFVVCCYGYTTFLPRHWSVGTFFTYYTMVFICILLYGGWKLSKRTRMKDPSEVDIIWERPRIDAYEAAFAGRNVGFWQECLELTGKRKRVETTV